MAHLFSQFANPQRFIQLTKGLIPLSAIAAILFVGAGTVIAFFFSPPDYKQGESVRIMYVHVPAAWMAIQVYFSIAVASFVSFIWRHRLADVIARVMAPLGVAFTVLALFTGSLWGKVTWGVYWDWDPRLVSMLVLLFLYVGYIALWNAIEEEATAARIAALLAMIGAINLPIIKFSVDWWDSLHQKATVIRDGGPSMPASMLWPLGLMTLGYIALTVFYTLIRSHTALATRRTDGSAPAPRPSSARMETAP